MDIRGQTGSDTIIVGDFNTQLSPPDRSAKIKINEEISELNYTTDQMGLAIKYRIIHQTDTGSLLRSPWNVP